MGPMENSNHEEILEFQELGILDDNLKSFLKDIKTMVENLPVVVCVYHGTKHIYVNSAHKKALGYTKEEMYQKDFWEFVHPDHREMVKARGLARLRGEVVLPNYQFKCIAKNGEERWFNQFFASTSLRGENVTVSAAFDVTESRRLKEELQSARNELETRVTQRTEELNRKNQELNFLNQSLNHVLQNMADGVVTFDRYGRFEILNPFFSPRSDAMFREVQNKMHDLFMGDGNDFLNRLIEKNEPFRDEEIRLVTSNGSLNLLASGTPILNEFGTFSRGVILLRPIKDVHCLVNRISGARAVFRFDDIITCSPVVLKLIENLKHSTSILSNVLISGESGTGKEMFAQAVHNASPRRKGPFVAVNCGAIPRELIGSELFGYVGGAFTGAKKGGNPGKFELANGGTLFLDEIGDMPLELQVILLRVLQEKKIMRIGGREEIPVDVRVVCATNKDLIDAMNKGSFRKDLYFRINVINVKIPALRERREDIMILFKHFLEKTEIQSHKKIKPVHPEIEKYLLRYNWPGNVRELQNIVERIVHNMQGCSIEAEHLPDEIRADYAKVMSQEIPNTRFNPPKLTLREARALSRKAMMDAERTQIVHLLDKYGGNISQVAKELGVARSTIYKK